MNKTEDFLKNIDLEGCEWASATLKLFPLNLDRHAELYNFVTLNIEKGQKIDVSLVVGTKHSKYAQEETWLSMLSSAQRIEARLEDYKKTPDHYFLKQRGEIERLSYATINGRDHYVDGNGNHRTTIAKFVLQNAKEKYLYDVDIAYYKIDIELYKAYKRLSFFCKKNKNFQLFYQKDKNEVPFIALSQEFPYKYHRFFTSEEIYSFIKKENNIFKRILRKLYILD